MSTQLKQIDRSAIQWTGATWNPWQGCIKVSPGCKFCYMYRDKKRYGQDPSKVVRSATATFNKPLKWQREAEDGSREGQDRFVFTCSWSDWFIEEADDWRLDAWDIIRVCPDLIFQILTKRADLIAERLPPWWNDIAAHVWLGVSIETQEQIGRAITLTTIPAITRFLSLEPLLGPINLSAIPSLELISWIIVGGESGGKDSARLCDIEWVRSIVKQCAAAGIPCFVKQLGSKPLGIADHIAHRDCGVKKPDGFYRILNDSHGGDPEEWPADIRVRQMPLSPTPTGAE